MRSVVAGAASFFLVFAPPASAALVVLDATPVHAAGVVNTNGGNNQGGNNQGQNGNNQGQNQGGTKGTKTPELPSAVLVAIGLVPLLTGAAVLSRRRRSANSQ